MGASLRKQMESYNLPSSESSLSHACGLPPGSSRITAKHPSVLSIVTTVQQGGSSVLSEFSVPLGLAIMAKIVYCPLSLLINRYKKSHNLELRVEPRLRLTKDGFSLLAMGYCTLNNYSK